MTEGEIVGLFQKHLVPIHITFKKPGRDDHRCLVTAFVLEVSGDWYLMTAGHCIEHIESNLDEGYTATCFLFDGLQPNAIDNNPIPFPYVRESTFWLHQGGDDYGVIPVHSYYRRLLAANGVVALNEEVWKKQPEQIDFFILLGYPMQLLKHDGDFVLAGAVLMKVVALPERPDPLEATEAERFYGSVSLEGPLTELEGCSGGPILAFRTMPDGSLRYWLHAVQSAYAKLPGGKGVIAACPMTPLGELIEETAHEVAAALAAKLETQS